jgi:hypothetical protein
MNKNVILALLAGLLGGGLVTRYVAPPVAFAQNPAPVTREVRAQSFTLVDSLDHAAATFSVEPRGPGQARIVLHDSRGREIWSAGGSGMLPLTSR